MCRGSVVGMPFNTKLVLRVNGSIFKNSGDEFFQIGRRKESRRTTTQVQLANNRLFVHELLVAVPFGKDGLYILFFNTMVGGDFFIAAAIGTKRFTERQMNIQANAPLPVFFLKLLLKNGLPLQYIDMIVPERNSRVAGIPGNGNIVFVQ